MTEPLSGTHSTYDRLSGTFGAKADAEATAETLREYIGQYIQLPAPEKAITIEGKKGFYLVKFPRLNRYWYPNNVDPGSLLDALRVIFNDFADIYPRATQGGKRKCIRMIS